MKIFVYQYVKGPFKGEHKLSETELDENTQLIHEVAYRGLLLGDGELERLDLDREAEHLKERKVAQLEAKHASELDQLMASFEAA